MINCKDNKSPLFARIGDAKIVLQKDSRFYSFEKALSFVESELQGFQLEQAQKIKKELKTLKTKYHPDKNLGNEEVAKKIFQLLSQFKEPKPSKEKKIFCTRKQLCLSISRFCR